MTPRVSIFFRTYSKDADWFPFAAASLLRQARRFHEVVVHCDAVDAPVFRPLLPAGWRLEHCEPLHKLPYCAQQAAKAVAFRWCTGDAILFWDSDCIAHRLMQVEALFEEGCIIMAYEPYATLGETGARVWKQPTEQVLGHRVDHEFMRRHPMTYWSEMLRELHDRHGIFHQRVPRSSEFNVFGGYAFHSPVWHARYDWRKVSDGTMPELFCTQYYSHDRLAKHHNAVMELLER